MNQISKSHLNDLRAHVAMPAMSGAAPEPVEANGGTNILAPDGQEKAIGERLAQARKAAGITRTTLAKAIGRRGAQVITDYEAGTSKVRLSTVRQIAAATGADVTWLWLGRKPADAVQTVSDRPALVITDISSPDDSRLLAAIEDGLVQRRRWADARAHSEYVAILRDWNQPGRVAAEASIAACVPNTLIGLRAKADYALYDWKRDPRTPDAYARVHAGVMVTLEQAMDRLSSRTIPSVAPVSGSDAMLIALCTRHDALLAEANRIGDTSTPGEALDQQMNRLTGEAGDLMGTIATMRATSPAGIVALARTTAANADGMLIDNDSDPLLQMLFRDSLALGTAHAVPAPGPSTEITTAIAAVIAARDECERVFKARGDDEECDATAGVHGEALDACGSLRVTTLADASAIATLALQYLDAGDICGQGDVVTRGLLQSLAGIVSAGPHPDTALPGAGATLTEPVLALIAEANRLRAETAAFPWDKSSQAEFDDLCIRTSAAVHAVAAAPTTSRAGLKAVAQFLLEEQTSGGGSEGFNHSDAENAALIMLKRLAADPAPSNPDADIIAQCDQVVAAWTEYWRLGDVMNEMPEAEWALYELEVINPTYNGACDLYDKLAEGPIPQTAMGLHALARAAVFQGADVRAQDAYKIEMAQPGADLAWKLVGHLAGLEVRSMSDGIG